MVSNLSKDDIKKEQENTEDIISGEQSNDKPSGRFKVNLHMVIIAIIVIIAVVAVFRLMRWNKGVASDYDPNYVTTEFDVEALDMIIPMDQSRLEGHAEDGELHILCLGNNPFSDERGKNGFAAMIGEKTDAVVYNAAFPDSSAALKYPVYNSEYPNDLFNLYYVTQSIISGSFSDNIKSVAADKDDKAYLEAANVLDSLDMDKIDIMIIMYDSTDYNIQTPSDNPGNPLDVTSYTGGLRMSIQNIQEAYPHIRIFVMSHSYAMYKDDDGTIKSGNTTDLGHGNLPHYLVMEADVAMEQGVSFIDNYFGTINEDNYKEYLADHMHYNKKGRELLADRIADIIINRSSTVSSTTENSK